MPTKLTLYSHAALACYTLPGVAKMRLSSSLDMPPGALRSGSGHENSFCASCGVDKGFRLVPVVGHAAAQCGRGGHRWCGMRVNRLCRGRLARTGLVSEERILLKTEGRRSQLSSSRACVQRLLANKLRHLISSALPSDIHTRTVRSGRNDRFEAFE